MGQTKQYFETKIYGHNHYCKRAYINGNETAVCNHIFMTSHCFEFKNAEIFCREQLEEMVIYGH